VADPVPQRAVLQSLSRSMWRHHDNFLYCCEIEAPLGYVRRTKTVQRLTATASRPGYIIDANAAGERIRLQTISLCGREMGTAVGGTAQSFARRLESRRFRGRCRYVARQ
jgi:hypothetical protein